MDTAFVAAVQIIKSKSNQQNKINIFTYIIIYNKVQEGPIIFLNTTTLVQYTIVYKYINILLQEICLQEVSFSSLIFFKSCKVAGIFQERERESLTLITKQYF
eukprot:TRINITY_DN8841_c1_g1_i3.p4 TRINITY_DN8841_c1_g1~~TRINITY_DN8841_c1_g1_i3.p4  ORF type:complete len:103 (-),score=0.91 TRINITY_DN8841_c1_g1_i3:564-872(-)